MTDGINIIRENNSLTGPAEQFLLRFAAQRLPAVVTPDVLTLLGVVGAILTFGAYAATNFDARFLWVANLGLVLHWFGDSMDGTLARYRRHERPRYGFFLDQTVDVLTDVLIAAGIGVTPFVSFGVAMLALAGYHALSLHALIVAVVTGRFKIASMKIGATEMRLAIVCLNFAILLFGADVHVALGVHYTWCDVAVLAVAMALFASFLVGLIKGRAVFAKAEAADEVPRASA